MRIRKFPKNKKDQMGNIIVYLCMEMSNSIEKMQKDDFGGIGVIFRFQFKDEIHGIFLRVLLCGSRFGKDKWSTCHRFGFRPPTQIIEEKYRCRLRIIKLNFTDYEVVCRLTF